MDIGSLVAYLGADIKDLKKSIRNAEKHLSDYSKKTDKELDKTEKKWKSSSSNIGKYIKGIGTAVVAYFSVTTIRDWTEEIVRAGIRIQSLENSFKAITVTGQDARNELKFVATTAHDLGLNLRALEDSYKLLAAASLNTTLEGQGARDVFYAVSEATSAMQLSATQSHAALYALQQMMSKGRVQTEELRRQLGEQLPGAFKMAAEAMNVTEFELNKMLERGEVVSEEFLPRFAQVLHERFGQAAVKNAELARGAFNRYFNAVEQLKRNIAESGLLDFFQLMAESATRVIEATNATFERRSKEGQKNELKERIEQTKQLIAEQEKEGYVIIGIGKRRMGLKTQLIAYQKKLREISREEEFADEERRKMEHMQISNYQKIQEEKQKQAKTDAANELHQAMINTYHEERLKVIEEQTKAYEENVKAAKKQAEAESKHRKEMQPLYDALSEPIGLDEFDRWNAQLDEAEETITNIVDMYDGLFNPVGLSEWEREWGDGFWKNAEKEAAETEKNLKSMLDDFFKDVENYESPFQKYIDDINDSLNAVEYFENAAVKAFKGIEDALVDLVMTGKLEWKSLINSMLAELVRFQVRKNIIAPLSNGFSSIMGGLFSAKGNVFNNLGLQAFAKGGTFTNSIVNSPTMFAHGGGFGVMGEAGAEAVMPLARTSSGDLGVKSEGMPNILINVINKGQAVSATQQGPQWDGERWVIGIVLDAMQKNKGGFANNMKAMVGA